MATEISNTAFYERRFFAELPTDLQKLISVFSIPETSANPVKLTFDHEKLEVKMHTPDKEIERRLWSYSATLVRATRFVFGEKPYSLNFNQAGNNFHPTIISSRMALLRDWSEWFRLIALAIPQPITNLLYKGDCEFDLDYDNKIARIKTINSTTGRVLLREKALLKDAGKYPFQGTGWTFYLSFDGMSHLIDHYPETESRHPVAVNGSLEELLAFSRLTKRGKTLEIRPYIGKARAFQAASDISLKVLVDFENVAAEYGCEQFRIYEAAEKVHKVLDREQYTTWKERQKTVRRGRRRKPIDE